MLPKRVAMIYLPSMIVADHLAVGVDSFGSLKRVALRICENI